MSIKFHDLNVGFTLGGGGGGGPELLNDYIVNTTTSSYYTGFPGSQAVSGIDNSNWWGCGNSTVQQWIQVELSSAKTVSEIRFSTYWTNGSLTWQSAQVILQGSNDGSTFDTLGTFSSLPGTGYQLVNAITSSTAYKYYRCVCSTSNSYWTGLGKLQFFGV